MWQIPELKKRILFTLGLFAVYRIGVFVILPGVN
jgi:preprotein translocase subunit SecY